MSEASFSEYLTSKQVLTEWQAGKILRGQYKGFYFDNFVILSPAPTVDDDELYSARDTTTNRLVLLKIWRNICPEDQSETLSYRVVERDTAIKLWDR